MNSFSSLLFPHLGQISMYLKLLRSYLKPMKNLKSAVGLTSYFFSLPSAHLLVFGMLIVGFVFGIFIDLGRYGGIDLFIQGSLDGILLLTAPALLSSALIKLLIRKMPFRRIAAVALAGQLIY